MERIELGLWRVLAWIGFWKVLDNLSTLAAVKKYGWDAEINVLINSLGPVLGYSTVMWATLPLGVAAAYVFYKKKFWNPVLEVFMVVLPLVPFANWTQNRLLWLLIPALTGVFLLRITYLDMQNRGWKVLVVPELRCFEPMFFKFKSGDESVGTQFI